MSLNKQAGITFIIFFMNTDEQGVCVDSGLMKVFFPRVWIEYVFRGGEAAAGETVDLKPREGR